MSFEVQQKVRVILDNVEEKVPESLEYLDYVEGKITSIITDKYWIKVDTDDGFEILCCTVDALEDLTVIDDITVEEVEKIILPKNTTECECGAWATEWSDFHAHWCKMYKDIR